MLVGHSLGNIEHLCERAIWLDNGEIRAQGETKSVIRAYRDAGN